MLCDMPINNKKKNIVYVTLLSLTVTTTGMEALQERASNS